MWLVGGEGPNMKSKKREHKGKAKGTLMEVLRRVRKPLPPPTRVKKGEKGYTRPKEQRQLRKEVERNLKEV